MNSTIPHHLINKPVRVETKTTTQHVLNLQPSHPLLKTLASCPDQGWLWRRADDKNHVTNHREDLLYVFIIDHGMLAFFLENDWNTELENQVIEFLDEFLPDWKSPYRQNDVIHIEADL